MGNWFNFVVSTYLYGVFNCVFKLCQRRFLQWIHTLYLFEWSGTLCLHQAQSLMFKWLQLNMKPQPLSSKTNTHEFNQTGQLIELYCEYLSVWCIWLCVHIMSETLFRVIRHSIITSVLTNTYLETYEKPDVKVTATRVESTSTYFVNEHSSI